jgi:tetratricopeptide (TPR) repeat protein
MRHLRFPQHLIVGLIVMAGLLTSSPLCFASDSDYDLHDNAWEHNRKGEWLLNRQDFIGALEEFNAGLIMSAGSGREATFYNNIGMTYMNLGQSLLAVDNFQMACRLSPTYALYRLNLIRAYTQGQNLQELERAFLRIVIDNQSDAEGWFILGLLFRSESQPEKAIDCFKHYLQLQPGSEMAKAAKLLIKEQEPPKKIE